MKKKYFGITVCLVLLFGITILIYLMYHDSNFVKQNLEAYTGLEEYILKYEYFDNSESFIEVLIPKIEKKRLLKKFQFETKFESKLKGRIDCTYITENPDYVYYLIKKGYGPYGYILIAIEINGNTLQVYEYYSN